MAGISMVLVHVQNEAKNAVTLDSHARNTGSTIASTVTGQTANAGVDSETAAATTVARRIALSLNGVRMVLLAFFNCRSCRRRRS